MVASTTSASLRLLWGERGVMTLAVGNHGQIQGIAVRGSETSQGYHIVIRDSAYRGLSGWSSSAEVQAIGHGVDIQRGVESAISRL